jgi:hypothetical protein
MRRILKVLAVAGVLGLIPAPARACPDFHLDRPDPTGTSGQTPSFGEAAGGVFLVEGSVGLAPVTGWKLNLSNATGQSPNPQMNALVSQISADVQQVWFDSSYVYVRHTGVPSHDTGRPDNANPAYASNLNRTSRIPRYPTIATQHTSTPNGGIGVMVNGALFFNAGDARSYQNLNIWHSNANVSESGTFDTAPGHAAPGPGAQPSPTTPGSYHYHQGPVALLNQIDAGNSGQRHSPLIGFAFDGFPVYGPYGYSDGNDAGSGIVRVTSSYKIRDDIATTGLRRSLSDGGPLLPSNQWGPNVGSQYPAGYYLQDYAYQPGLGELNEYNVRWTITPDYPQGTWAYFMTLDASGAVFPYIVGPRFFGVLDTANTGPNGGNAAIPAGAARLQVGDANVDGRVDLSDFNVLAATFGQHGLWLNGDFNRDGLVNLADFNLFASNFGMTAGPAGPSGGDWAALAAAVPEPAVGFCLVLCLVGPARRRADGARH